MDENTTLKLYRKYKTEKSSLGNIRRKCDGSILVFSDTENVCDIDETMAVDSYLSYKSGSGTTGNDYVKPNQTESAFLPVLNSSSNFGDYFIQSTCLTEVDFSNVKQDINLACKLLFSGCTNLKKVTGLEKMKGFSQVEGMFKDCHELTGFIDISNINNIVSGQTLEETFMNCYKIEGIKLGPKLKVESIANICSGCSSLKVIDMSDVDLSPCTDIYNAFKECRKLEMVDITSLNPYNIFNDYGKYGVAFSGCPRLRHIRCNAAFKYFMDKKGEINYKGSLDLESKNIEWHVAW